MPTSGVHAHRFVGERRAGSRRVAWNALYGVASDDHRILFTAGPVPVVYIPTDALASEQEVRDLPAFAEGCPAAVHAGRAERG